jgi:4-diphosphocytidyl-2-C-methyl-D-erythritol kinase
VIASAPGKVNLHFGVGSLELDGYHEVVSVYQALNLRERVTISRSKDAEWSIAVAGSLGPDQLALVPTDESNLVVRASLLAAELAALESPRALDIKISKQIPVAGGMAGGSADAAAAFLAAAEKFGLDLSFDALQFQSRRLGADVPFCMHGGTALGLGRGDRLERLQLGAELHFVMISSRTGLSTPKVYAELDRQREQAGVDPHEVAAPEHPSALIEALAEGNIEQIAQLIHNDLEPAALALQPDLELTLATAEKYGALRAFVSGSGPTVAAMVASAEAAAELVAKLHEANFDSFATSTSPLGAQLESE